MAEQDMLFDKLQVRNHFDRASGTYDRAAVLQREVADRLLGRLDYVKIKPGAIVDVGAGTGYLGDGLLARFSSANLFELDVSLQMLITNRNKLPWYKRILKKKNLLCADAENLPLASESMDLIISNLTMQWCNQLGQTFSEFRRVLKPGGLLMFTTFGPDTLTELRQSWAAVDNQAHVSRFLDMHDIGDALLQTGLSEPVMDVEHFTLTYSDARGLFDDLKSIGATNSLASRQRGLLGKAAYMKLLNAYEQFRQQGSLPATYEVVYGHAWKPVHASAPLDARHQLPVG
jgi:malonyl-CoA O-methyltransferase